MRIEVDNCYQCANCQVCYLRMTMEDLLDTGHHRLIVGGESALKNSIPLPFLRELAKICRIKVKNET